MLGSTASRGERGPCMARAHSLGTPWCSARRPYERGVKPFGSTVKKEVRIEVESWEKICGYVAGIGEFENVGQKPLGPRERAQKSNFQKFVWALSRGPRGFCPSFSNSPTPATYPQIFSQLSTSILTSFFTVLPNCLTPRSYVLLALHQGVPNLWARAIHGPRSPHRSGGA